YETGTVRFEYESPTTPRSVFDYDVARRTRELKKRDEVLGGYDPARYEVHRTFARTPDGARVPISLVSRKGTPRDGKSPLYLYGYGAYGFTIEPGFNANRLSLLDRGWVFAIAHVRGGVDLGRDWYEQGRLLH